VSQVRKTSSSSGTYLCLMQGNACGIWTLGVMFPPGYRVSNCEGYKQGSAWLRMQTASIVTREKLSMAKGKPQQTGMTAEINSIPTYAI
jgi:hypothetical protein